jgi:hypothetical protein
MMLLSCFYETYDPSNAASCCQTIPLGNFFSFDLINSAFKSVVMNFELMKVKTLTRRKIPQKCIYLTI